MAPVFERAALFPVYKALLTANDTTFASAARDSVLIDVSSLHRISSYKEAIASFMAHPIIGSGWATNFSPHNVFLQILCESGLVGMTAFVLFFFYIFFNLYKIIRSRRGEGRLLVVGVVAALVAVVVYLMAEPGFYQTQVWFPIGLGLAVIWHADSELWDNTVVTAGNENK